jgi:hypothetical protein
VASLAVNATPASVSPAPADPATADRMAKARAARAAVRAAAQPPPKARVITVQVGRKVTPAPAPRTRIVNSYSLPARSGPPKARP